MTSTLAHAALEVLGSPTKGSLAKAEATKVIEVQFNPTEFTLQKNLSMAEIAIPGLDAPIVQFSRGQSETLNVDLFFDTTEAGTGTSVKPVTTKTDEFYQLVRIDPDTHAPPICRFVWSNQAFPGSQYADPWSSQSRSYGFTCIIESIRQRFTFFNPDGVPLRATLTLTLKEYQTLQDQIDRIGFKTADRTSAHAVAEGETLNQISADVYDDPRAWREIAEANNIDEPWRLRPATILRVPKRSGRDQ